ncbi:alpha/beta hydrolase [Methylobacterium gregans]|uniref:2-succinyl-6-hydroxy-2, 4-cyclohexadiene-1-carboxylate synthase n=2 Tax=Methylobacterium gregans TaxID=374424 RepID=A0AA37HSC9_9HYPH|nr:alpha/beta fold hydrolase [Methylobacterium gregans]MDQ0523750.1 pimeloyl-ACP methyl ester carboxylesterase [Methylobacterium gregans]GJD81207.1 2-succinyl-6-hydroxy-2, 4-cyclohexadiene-1-carboxylate synthase [Methylobacterium gregans]GLS54806.1 alpha/beta hydrolase [Methylobacterium gregans]
MSAARVGDPACPLEIIRRMPVRDRGRPRLLFVHGISVGAWIWDEHVLPWFAEAGFEACALSLRGHGASWGQDGIAEWRLADYTADLDQVARSLGGPLVVVGHSLGGAVVQNWIRTGGRPLGMALLASVPPWGLALSALRMGLSTPALFRAVLAMSLHGARAADPAILRAGLFSDDVDKSSFRRFVARVGEESRLVGPELQGWPPFAPLAWQAPRSFVLGGADDRFIPADEVWRTGAYYGCRPHIVPRLAHALMLEPRWQDAVLPLRDWLLTLPRG